MSTAFYSPPECRLHDMGAGHPECPQRLDAISDHLRATGIDIVPEDAVDDNLHSLCRQSRRGASSRV